MLASGGDPTAWVEATLAALPACRALDDQAEDPFLIEARMQQIRAAWADRHGGRPLPFAEQALQAARKAVELGPESADAAAEKVRACIRLAALSSAKARDELLTEGLIAVDKGLKVKADSGPLLALRAAVLKAQSRLTKDPAAQTSLSKESQASWERSLAINPLLAREYGAELRGP